MPALLATRATCPTAEALAVTASPAAPGVWTPWGCPPPGAEAVGFGVPQGGEEEPSEWAEWLIWNDSLRSMNASGMGGVVIFWPMEAYGIKDLCDDGCQDACREHERLNTDLCAQGPRRCWDEWLEECVDAADGTTPTMRAVFAGRENLRGWLDRRGAV